MKSTRWFVFVGFVFLPSTTARAQASTLADGDRVRFTLAGGSVEHNGGVRATTADSLILRSCDDCTQSRFAFSDFTRLSVSRLDDVHRGKRTAVGAASGFFVGLLVGSVAGRNSASSCSAPGCGLKAISAALTGAGIGAVAGGIIGATRQPGHWVRVL